MTTGITMKFQLGGRRGRGPRTARRTASVPPEPTAGRIPRVSKLMALAIRWDRLIREGVVVDYAEIARLTHLTRARVTQIMNLLNLAPDIQERILLLDSMTRGKDIVSERRIRPVTAALIWNDQRAIWRTQS